MQASKPGARKAEAYVRLITLVLETGLSLDEILKAKKHNTFFVYVTPSSEFGLTPTDWTPLAKESHGFLLYRYKNLHEDSQFKIVFGLGESQTFKVSDIHVKQSVYRAIKEMAPSSKRPRPPEAVETNRGAHWEARRIEILVAALQVVSESNSDKMVKIWIGEGQDKRLNATKLAERIHDNRHRWPALKEEVAGTSFRNITDTLQQALKTTD